MNKITLVWDSSLQSEEGKRSKPANRAEAEVVSENGNLLFLAEDSYNDNLFAIAGHGREIDKAHAVAETV